MGDYSTILTEISFNDQGLVPVIAQQHSTGEVLMMAWMNKDALIQTLETGKMCYWSRSRGALWVKGERSGQHQILKEMTIDCDGDTILAKVDQTGVACHTGRPNCFFKRINGTTIDISQDVVTDPSDLYGK